MADITFSCSSCGQELEAPEEYAGELVACPNCQSEITVPSSSLAAGAEAGAAVDPDDDDPDDEDGDDQETDGSCPECGADMEPDTVLCMSCGFHKGMGKRIGTDFDNP
jgi:DNA-directed RNA polymerase subunit RPC12/RpoP